MKSGHNFQTKYAVSAYAASRHLWDTPIFESRSFVVVPTVGALVEGWLLVVPKTGTLSFARLSPSQLCELETFLGEIVPSVESIYGPISIFEHGPAIRNSSVGCGVDYAHLHLVPTQCDLLAGSKKIAPNIHWTQIKSFGEVQNCAAFVDGYWFLKQNYNSTVCYLGTCEHGSPTSQLFRRVIANHIGKPADYDWKQSSGEALMSATVDKLLQSPHFA